MKTNLHHWDVLAISCIDGRFIKRTVDFIAEKTNGIFDFRTEVGASKGVIFSVEDRERFFSVIDTSIKLHDIKEVWVFDHQDCGAYGGSAEHANAEEEKKFHLQKLDEAARLINVHYSTLKVRKFYLDWETIEEL